MASRQKPVSAVLHFVGIRRNRFAKSLLKIKKKKTSLTAGSACVLNTSVGLWGLLLLKIAVRFTVTFVYYVSDQPHTTFTKATKLERKEQCIRIVLAFAT